MRFGTALIVEISINWKGVAIRAQSVAKFSDSVAIWKQSVAIQAGSVAKSLTSVAIRFILLEMQSLHRLKCGFKDLSY